VAENGQGVATAWPRCGRGTAKVRPRRRRECGRGMAKVWPRGDARAWPSQGVAGCGRGVA
jgi:hypothetical protein